MGAIQVTSKELRAQAAELTTLNEQFKKETGNLEAQEAALNLMWEGSANDAFHTAFQNDKTQMTAFSNLIAQYVQTLLQIAAKYEAAEAKNLSTASTRNYK